MSSVGVQDGGAAHRKSIWITFWILFIITIAEFIVAFAMERGPLRNVLFVVMTLAKAFFIVGEFMHLRHEVRDLMLTVILPLLFVVWFITVCLVEGSWYLSGWFAFLGQ